MAVRLRTCVVVNIQFDSYHHNSGFILLKIEQNKYKLKNKRPP
jgi:hypothetical protein